MRSSSWGGYICRGAPRCLCIRTRPCAVQWLSFRWSVRSSPFSSSSPSPWCWWECGVKNSQKESSYHYHKCVPCSMIVVTQIKVWRLTNYLSQITPMYLHDAYSCVCWNSLLILSGCFNYVCLIICLSFEFPIVLKPDNSTLCNWHLIVCCLFV